MLWNTLQVVQVINNLLHGFSDIWQLDILIWPKFTVLHVGGDTSLALIYTHTFSLSNEKWVDDSDVTPSMTFSSTTLLIRALSALLLTCCGISQIVVEVVESL